MKQNMGSIDRVLRIIIAVVIASLYFAHMLTGTLGIVLMALAGIFLLTSFIGTCPLYLPFGITTRAKEKK
jgi:hypothetical protein